MEENSTQLKAMAAIAIALVLFATLCGMVWSIINEFYSKDLTESEVVSQTSISIESSTESTLKDNRPIPIK